METLPSYYQVVTSERNLGNFGIITTVSSFLPPLFFDVLVSLCLILVILIVLLGLIQERKKNCRMIPHSSSCMISGQSRVVQQSFLMRTHYQVVGRQDIKKLYVYIKRDRSGSCSDLYFSSSSCYLWHPAAKIIKKPCQSVVSVIEKIPL